MVAISSRSVLGVISLRAKKQEKKSNKAPKILFLLCFVTISIYVLNQRGYMPTLAILSQGEGMTLKHIKDIVETDTSKRQEIIVNQDQVIIVTEDGLKAVSLEGEELWADTHTIKSIAIAQKAPYFAIGEKKGRRISVFDTYGKKTDIEFSNPVVYFSINQKGDIVVIEKTQDGHVVSGYDERGNSFGVKRITYVQDVGYPIAAEISPDGKVILISYINTDDINVSSQVIAVGVGDGGLAKVDSILYGKVYEDTIISEIEFINENVWIAAGDNNLIFNRLNGEEIKKIEDRYINYITTFEKMADSQGAYYATVSSVKPTMSTVHQVENLIFYSQEGEQLIDIDLHDPVTYMYGDGRITILGNDRKFIAYNKLGKKRWEYTSTKDIQKVVSLYPQQRVIMISKGKVELMQIIK